MTKILYQSKIYKTDHTKFGGIIYPSDFNTDCRNKKFQNGSTIASRIACDAKFDKQCEKNRESIERNKQ